jgi:hypothetical protein
MILRGNGRLASRARSPSVPSEKFRIARNYFAYPVEETVGRGSSMKIAKFTEDASVEESVEMALSKDLAGLWLV